MFLSASLSWECMASMESTKLTWVALLGGWMQFARAAVALPDDAEGRAWRASVPAMIGLQAVCMAMRTLDQLPPDEQALGVDRSRVLLEQYLRKLHEHHGGRPFHPKLEELVNDAERAIEEAARRCAATEGAPEEAGRDDPGPYGGDAP